MKNFALGIALGASLVSTAAMAGEQRPTYLAFSAPKAPHDARTVAPAAPTVTKRNKAAGAIPLYIPLLGAVGIAGFVAAISSGGGGNDGSPG